MNQNPLFPQTNTDKPDVPAARPKGANSAAELIRQKIDALYASEPDAKQEMREAEIVTPRSKHQQYMHELSTSGRGLAEIQVAWHEYYTNLPDDEKHKVWQEFYQKQQTSAPKAELVKAAVPAVETKPPVTEEKFLPPANDSSVISGEFVVPSATDTRPVSEVRDTIRKNIGQRAKKINKSHFQSLIFGLGSGFVVLLIFMFGFFNEVVITPFIRPAAATSAPIIVDAGSTDVERPPQVVIPKISVQVPVDFTQTSISDSVIQGALDNGVVHYPTTVKPGEKGNAAIFGHSSSNIFNQGKYKFAFMQLNKLQNDDVFYITYQNKIYSYKVISMSIVPPTQVSVLNPIAGQTATATLITCDPPGTSINRLVVVGQQISPDPNANTTVATPAPAASDTTELPANGPTLWTRMWRAVF